jgi:hypothetical protein
MLDLSTATERTCFRTSRPSSPASAFRSTHFVQPPSGACALTPTRGRGRRREPDGPVFRPIGISSTGVDDDNLFSRMSNCSSSPAGADIVASRLARARCRDNHRLAAPVEGQRDEIRLSGTAWDRNPDVDLSPQPHELDPLVTRPHDRRSPDPYRRQCRLLGRRTTGRHLGGRLALGCASDASPERGDGPGGDLTLSLARSLKWRPARNLGCAASCEH